MNMIGFNVEEHNTKKVNENYKENTEYLQINVQCNDTCFKQNYMHI